jgi:ADP-heptose:LPS heptosyltransferase
MVKFLVIRFSSIGDIILTTPVVRCLKNQVDEAEVHFLTKERYIQILTSNPYIDKVHLLKENLGEVITKLRKERFDYIIDLHRNIRTFFVKLMLRKVSFSVNKINLRKWIFVNFKWNVLPDKHIVDRYLKTLRFFSVHSDGKGLDFYFPPVQEVAVSKILGKKPQKFLSLVVGGGHLTKQIPADKIVELIDKMNIDIVLLGGKEDVDKALQIMSRVKNKNVYNLAGKLSLVESASVIDKSELIITPDTGMMHIAAALKKNIISVWGNTVPAFGMYPYMPGRASKMFQIDDLQCRPCSKIGFNKCPKKHFRCMLEQNTDEIVNTINEIL